MKWNVVHIDETDSTNRWLRECAPTDENLVVVADYQTAGRGCGTNTWESERGQNLTFSLLLHPTDVPAPRQFFISEVISVALCQTLDSYLGGNVSVKWPNDVYYGDRKLCGMLIENRLQGGLMKDSIVGIGLNVNQQRFLSDAPNPVSLRQLLGRAVDRDQLLTVFLDAVSATWTSDTVSTDYRSRLYRREGFHTYSDADGCFQACLTGVLPDGRLVLTDADGRERRYAFKQVQYVL